MDTGKKILIVKLSAIGDVVHALPCLPFLRNRFPQAYIAWIVEKKAKDILEGNRYIDEIIVIDTKKWRKEIFSPFLMIKTVREILSVVSGLKGRKYDIAVDMQGLAKSGFITFLSGAKVRTGFHYRDCREKLNFFFTNCKAGPTSPHTHIVDKNLGPIEVLDIDVTKRKKDFFLFVTSSCQERADSFLQYPFSNGHCLIGINPGGGWSTKLWNIQRYAQLADALRERYAVTILLLWGSNKEESMVQQISRRMKEQPVIAYKTSLKELCALMKRCDCIIGSDTGPIHIADALGVRTVALFGPSSVFRNAPYRDKGVFSVTGVCESSGCYKRTCEKSDCMDSITVEDVLQKVKELLSVIKKKGF